MSSCEKDATHGQSLSHSTSCGYGFQETTNQIQGVTSPGNYNSLKFARIGEQPAHLRRQRGVCSLTIPSAERQVSSLGARCRGQSGILKIDF